MIPRVISYRKRMKKNEDTPTEQNQEVKKELDPIDTQKPL